MAENFKTFAIALDIKVASYAKIPVVEGDTGNRFVITLTDDGTAVDLSTSRVVAVFSGSMGTRSQDSWTSTDGLLVISGASHNIITFDLLNGSYASGLNTCELQVYSGATYTRLVTSASFTFNARKPILNDTTIASTTEYPILVSLIDQVESLTDREQADWDETDDTKGTFINNKPVIGTDIQAPTDTLTAETTLSDTDTVPFYDASATAHRKSTWANILAKIRTALFGSVTGVAKLDGAGNVSAAAANADFAAATHASRHASGAADAITPSAIGAQAAMTAGIDYADPTTISTIIRNGFFTGGDVTAQGTPNQTVAVSSGEVVTPEGKRYPFNAVSSLAATSADATNPRIDIVYVNSAGTVTYLAGTAAAAPTQPSTPANGTVLAIVRRAANDNTISTSDITLAVAGKYGVAALDANSVVTPSQARAIVQTKTSSFTLGAADAEKLTLLYSSSTINVELPIDSTYNFPVGTAFNFVRWGSGACTFSLQSGAAWQVAGGAANTSISATASAALAVKVAANTWWLSCG